MSYNHTIQTNVMLTSYISQKEDTTNERFSVDTKRTGNTAGINGNTLINL